MLIIMTLLHFARILLCQTMMMILKEKTHSYIIRLKTERMRRKKIKTT